MSTPCIITKKENPTLAIYIHWDGDDKQMVQDIVNIAKNHNARNVNFDEDYGIARLACACGEYFDNEAAFKNAFERDWAEVLWAEMDDGLLSQWIERLGIIAP